jgi:YidC/Oxa1 family membrane protein insertase
MDRTSWIGVVVCLILLFTWGWWSTKDAAKRAEEQRAREAEIAANQPKEAAREEAPEATPGQPGQPGQPGPDTPGTEAAIAEESHILENEFVAFHLTNRGAGIRIAELKKQNRELGLNEPIALNETSSHPVAALSRGHGKLDTSTWSPGPSTATEATFETKTPEGLTLTKTFRLPTVGADPHELEMDITVRNDADTPLVFENRYLYSGAAAPLHLNEWSMQIGMYWYESDGGFEYKTVDHYGGRKFLGIFGKSEKPSDDFKTSSLEWAGVNDQFFALITKPEEPYEADLWGSRHKVVIDGDEATSEKKRMFAAEAGIGLPELTMNPGDQHTLRYRFYLGPKEFSRLKGLGEERQRVMHYDEIPIF